ncbi:hypothetical protein TNCT_56561 [Trichonephila clavata]|uniref:Uncharacterized protein n=1 Tax=Trichonephila clavata TaxID=2740835 RepID=A0A8X6F2B3_TRICU|nr:hypothetical protein TNCT_56561 [Trichonephila clavata]
MDPFHIPRIPRNAIEPFESESPTALKMKGIEHPTSSIGTKKGRIPTVHLGNFQKQDIFKRRRKEERGEISASKFTNGANRITIKHRAKKPVRRRKDLILPKENKFPNFKRLAMRIISAFGTTYH